MKTTLLNKILIPALSILITSTVLGALFISEIVVQRFESHTLSMLQDGNIILTKNIRSIANCYIDNIRSIAQLPYIRDLADVLQNPDQDQSLLDQRLKVVQELFENMPGNYQTFIQINFASKTGQVIASSHSPSIGKVNVHDRLYFKRALQGITSFSRPQISRSVGEKCIMVASPVYNNSQHIGGVVYFIIPCRWLAADTIDDVRMANTGYSYLVDFKSGLMLAHPDFQKVQTINMFYHQPWMKQLSPGESGLMTDYYNSKGKRRLVAYHMEPTSGWIAVSCIDAQEVERHGEEIRNLIIGLTLASTLIVAILLTVILRSVTSDVSFISRYAHDVAKGDLDRMLYLTRDDELGVLADALRSLVLSLKKTIHVEKEQNQSFREATQLLYTSIYQINVSRDRFSSQSLHKQFTSLDDKIRSYSESIQLLAKNCIKSEFQDPFLNFFAREKILQAFEKGEVNRHFDCLFHASEKDPFEWVRLDQHLFRIATTGDIHMYLYAKNINTEITNEIQARFDSLTGCLSRRALETNILDRLAHDPSENYAFFILDIDNFKTINDQFGHGFGDFCLKQFTQRLQSSFRRDDIIGRIGGDEFVIFISVASPDWLKEKAEKLRAALDMDCTDGYSDWHMTASIGIALYPQDATEYSELYQRADSALYASKANGKNSLHFFSDIDPAAGKNA
ncbi:MAG: diguanylate cyclase [Desulfovibrio sp.]|nr:diguanylate cyclase [Desulfovibrio sp.]